MTGPSAPDPAVRTARAADRDDVLALVRAAFATGGRDGQEELEFVSATWRLGASPPGLELVADDHGTVVGHVLAAAGDLGGRATIGIAPLAVAPERQRQGIGSALMVELLRRLERDRWPMAVLLGDPGYYSSFAISYPPVGVGSPYFMVRRFSTEDLGGEFAYCWESAGRAEP
jgi:putative acetyltransferase